MTRKHYRIQYGFTALYEGSMMKKLGVFISANNVKNTDYLEQTLKLSSEIVKRKIHLIYGGASVGLMGALADQVLALGGEATGVIPEILIEKEIAHHDLTKMHVVKSMHERKKLLTELSDAFIILPGGLGTLEEFFVTWNAVKIGVFNKKIGLLNINGYFDALIQFLNHAVEQEFITQSQRNLIDVAEDSSRLLDIMNIGY